MLVIPEFNFYKALCMYTSCMILTAECISMRTIIVLYARFLYAYEYVRKYRLMYKRFMCAMDVTCKSSLRFSTQLPYSVIINYIT